MRPKRYANRVVKIYFGRLCPQGHDAGGGKSRRYWSTTKCVECRKLIDAKRTREATLTRRQEREKIAACLPKTLSS